VNIPLNSEGIKFHDEGEIPMKQTTLTKSIIIHLCILGGLLVAQDSNISFPVAEIEKKITIR
jgi:hypothetical protein